MSLLADEDILLDNMDWMTTYMSKFNIKYICMNEHSLLGGSLSSTEPLMEHGLVMFDDKKLTKLNISLKSLEENCPIMTGSLNKRQLSKFSRDVKLKIYRICETVCKYYFEHGKGLTNINYNIPVEEYITKLMKPVKKGKYRDVMFRNRRMANYMSISIVHGNVNSTYVKSILDDFSILFDYR